MDKRLIYIADDEQNIRDLIKNYLVKEGYEVFAFENAELLLEQFRLKEAEMLIIDIMMSGMNGYELCREIRKVSEVPIIMVSAKDEEIDKILGLELGSDDYISKPFSPRELMVRVKTIFRRIKSNTVSISEMGNIKDSSEVNYITCCDIAVNRDERTVRKGNKVIEFTTKEFDFILYLIENKNRVFTRDQLITAIWGYDYIGETRAIDDLVKRVRKKLLAASSEMKIVTVWGYGYKVVG